VDGLNNPNRSMKIAGPVNGLYGRVPSINDRCTGKARDDSKILSITKYCYERLPFVFFNVFVSEKLRVCFRSRIYNFYVDHWYYREK
jgi:hypothetical protein